jgi:hypothetical protein
VFVVELAQPSTQRHAEADLVLSGREDCDRHER